MIAIATCFQWFGGLLGVVGISMGIVLVYREAKSARPGEEDNAGFHSTPQ